MRSSEGSKDRTNQPSKGSDSEQIRTAATVQLTSTLQRSQCQGSTAVLNFKFHPKAEKKNDFNAESPVLILLLRGVDPNHISETRLKIHYHFVTRNEQQQYSKKKKKLQTGASHNA